MSDEFVRGQLLVGCGFKLDSDCDGRIAEELFERFGQHIRRQYHETSWEHPVVGLRVTRLPTGEVGVAVEAYEVTVFDPDEVANVREIETDGEIPVVISVDGRPPFLTGYEKSPPQYLA